METPCINVCYVNRETRLCEGCGRTIDEISAWSGFTPQQRREVMAELADRLKTIKMVS